ncbi:hypothetical protein BLNAU_19768 [Blattamonas nauphoetae]|uniref:Uncharacterized protein n=1 Tax=Blattamonas nauphoetae TaxID=2049346 RepID=A0ABQ9X4T2_9EUKA|nr:hypothetical protein BLNAU_19768 [Blattamonas nauphoetae]
MESLQCLTAWTEQDETGSLDFRFTIRDAFLVCTSAPTAGRGTRGIPIELQRPLFTPLAYRGDTLPFPSSQNNSTFPVCASGGICEVVTWGREYRLSEIDVVDFF